MCKFFFKLLVGVVMWVVRIAGLRPAIRTTHITTPTHQPVRAPKARAVKQHLHFTLAIHSNL